MAAQIFGRYELVRLVGSGGMAQVHLARQRGPDGFVNPCVLKRIAANHADAEAVRRMFREEARISALLKHPNIVQVFDYGDVEGTPYLAMELVDGVNLAQLCRTLAQNNRWLPLQPAIDIVASILEALDYAHQIRDLSGNPLNLVHRDVSPQNTLLSRQGIVKLTDFGIARHDARDTQTVGLQAKGKPGYMAPEQAMSGQVDARADLFAVGIMLAELISARRVLTSKDRLTHILDIENRVRTLCALRKESPPELNEFAARLAALEPERRPATAREAAGLLRRASARIPRSVSLQEFLHDVFGIYFKDTNAPTGAPPPPVEAATQVAANTLISPPEASSSGLRFERAAWEASEVQPTATEAVYEQGWPENYLPDGQNPPATKLPMPAEKPVAPAPPKVATHDLELVAHSSSVDAMQYFQAQVSDDIAAHAPSEEEVAAKERERAAQHRLPYMAGQRPGGAGVEDTDTGLPPPVFGGEPDKQGNMLGFDAPELQDALKNIDEDKGEKKPFTLPPVIPLLGVALLVIGAAVGVLFVFSGGEEEIKAPAAVFGAIEVSSDPAGGQIYLDGRDTGKQTPAVLEGLPVEKAMRLAVRRDGHLSVPPDVVVRIPQLSLRTTARFSLQPGKAYRIVTTPEEATITVNGHRMGEVTPLTLPVIPYGESATLAISLDGFMPYHHVINSRTETATIVDIALEAGRSIEVSSNPPGAKVWLDGREIGQTPIYDVLVPVARRFQLKVGHRGFKTWRKRFMGKKLTSEPVVADLEPLPFLALPWDKDEKKRARSLDREYTQLSRRLETKRSQLKAAQRKQAVVEASVNASVGDLAEVQRRSDLLTEAVGELEQSLADLDAQMESMREQLLLRMDSE